MRKRRRKKKIRKNKNSHGVKIERWTEPLDNFSITNNRVAFSQGVLEEFVLIGYLGLRCKPNYYKPFE